MMNEAASGRDVFALDRLFLRYARQLQASQPRADYSIDQLPSIPYVLGTDKLPIFHNGSTFGATVSQLPVSALIPRNADFSTLGIFNVCASGAVGDGIHDDTAAINAASALGAAAGGGILLFPLGTYLINGKITPASNMIWMGMGQGASILKAGSTGWNGIVYDSTPRSSMLIVDLTFDLNAQNGISGFWLHSACSNITILRCEFKNALNALGCAVGDGVNLTASDNINFLSLYVHDNNTTGTEVVEGVGCTNFATIGCHFENNKGHVHSLGFYGYNSNGTIAFNRFVNCYYDIILQESNRIDCIGNSCVHTDSSYGTDSCSLRNVEDVNFIAHRALNYGPANGFGNSNGIEIRDFIGATFDGSHPALYQASRRVTIEGEFSGFYAGVYLNQNNDPTNYNYTQQNIVLDNVTFNAPTNSGFRQGSGSAVPNPRGGVVFTIPAGAIVAGWTITVVMDGRTVTYTTTGAELNANDIATGLKNAINADGTLGPLLTAANMLFPSATCAGVVFTSVTVAANAFAYTSSATGGIVIFAGASDVMQSLTNVIAQDCTMLDAAWSSGGMFYADMTAATTGFLVTGGKIGSSTGSSAYGVLADGTGALDLAILGVDMRSIGQNGIKFLQAGAWAAGGIRANAGYRAGFLTTPSFPASNGTLQNQTGFDVRAYVVGSASNATTLQLSFSSLAGAYTTVLVIPAGATGTIDIPAGMWFRATYSGGTPTWVWVGAAS